MFYKYIPPKMGLTPQGRLLPGGSIDLKSAPGFLNDVKRFWRKKTKQKRFYGRDLGSYQFCIGSQSIFSDFAKKKKSKKYVYIDKTIPPENQEKEEETAPPPTDNTETANMDLKTRTAIEKLELDRVKELRRESRTAIESFRNVNSLSRELRGWTALMAGFR